MAAHRFNKSLPKGGLFALLLAITVGRILYSPCIRRLVRTEEAIARAHRAKEEPPRARAHTHTHTLLGQCVAGRDDGLFKLWHLAASSVVCKRGGKQLDTIQGE